VALACRINCGGVDDRGDGLEVGTGRGLCPAVVVYLVSRRSWSTECQGHQTSPCVGCLAAWVGHSAPAGIRRRRYVARQSIEEYVPSERRARGRGGGPWAGITNWIRGRPVRPVVSPAHRAAGHQGEHWRRREEDAGSPCRRGIAGAPPGIIGERPPASRLPSLRSALRGFDPRLRSPGRNYGARV
jgi:hypothetical protein